MSIIQSVNNDPHGLTRAEQGEEDLLEDDKETGRIRRGQVEFAEEDEEEEEAEASQQPRRQTAANTMGHTNGIATRGLQP